MAFLLEFIFDIVGTEFALFACAFMVYFAFSGKLIGAKAPPPKVRADRADFKRLEPNPTRKSTASTPSPCDFQAKAADIRAYGKAHALDEALSLFESTLLLVPAPRNHSETLLFNSFLQACVECGDLAKADEYLKKARAKQSADTVSFNTVIKGHLASGCFDEARRLLDMLIELGHTPSTASYHGLIASSVGAGDWKGAWSLLKEMRSLGVAPNAATCCILLRGIQSPGNRGELVRVLELIDDLRLPFDETLLIPLIDASLIAKRVDLLSQILSEHQRRGLAPTLSAPTYGSIIKAFGQAHDVGRVWSTWKDMAKQGVQPTPVTLGCMVESLVSNGQAEDAWTLLQEMSRDDSTRSLINTVTYSTVLKGFAANAQKTMQIYEVMRERGIHCNTITYNTILNTFAKSGALHHVAGLLEDMRASNPAVEPDLVTYSTLVKVYCSKGDVQKAIGILDMMRKNGKHLPDEMMFNTLLDGCAKSHRLADALRLMDQMRAEGVVPSNFTLSMLVKLLGRCKKLNQAFSTVDSLAKEYGLRLNIQVYTCLMQACFQNLQPKKAVGLLDRLRKEGVPADQRTFTALIKGCLEAGQVDLVEVVVKRAFEGPRPVGLDVKDIQELTRLFGATSQVVQAITAPAKTTTSPNRGVGLGVSRRTPLAPWRRTEMLQTKGSGSDSGGSTTDISNDSLSD